MWLAKPLVHLLVHRQKLTKQRLKPLDVLQAEGFVSTDFVAPAKGKDRALYDSLKAAVVLGFEVRVQTLLAKDTKTLDDDAKKVKREWQQQIGSRMTDLKNGLAKRENPEGEKATASFELG
jgi:hypothetical protein